MASIPSSIQLPATIPTQDPALAGYLAQFAIGLNAWIVQAATALNQTIADLKTLTGFTGQLATNDQLTALAAQISALQSQITNMEF